MPSAEALDPSPREEFCAGEESRRGSRLRCADLLHIAASPLPRSLRSSAALATPAPALGRSSAYRRTFDARGLL